MKSKQIFSELTPPRQRGLLARFFALFFCLVLGMNVWGVTEVHPASSTSSADLSGTSYTIPGTYNAGLGGTKAGTMGTKGIKFRLGNNATTTEKGFVFNVNTGYKITGIAFDGHANDNTKTATIAKVYVDGNELDDFTSVALPAKTSSQQFSVSGFTATTSVVFITDGSAASQANLEFTVTYETVAVTKHDVIFEANGGTGTMASVPVAEGAQYTLPTCAFTAPDGKEFDAWTSSTTITDGKITMGISDITITATWRDITLSSEKKLTRALFSNGFDAFINETAHTVTAYYLNGETAPTLSVENLQVSTAASAAIAGSTITVTAEDGTTQDYSISLSAVTPYNGTGKQFDGTETWIKTGSIYKTTESDKTYYAWVINKNADDGRIPAGRNRIYFFVDAAQSITLINDRGTSLSSNRAIKVFVNGVEQGTPTSMPKYAADPLASITIATGVAAMIEIVSNQTNGDTGWGTIAVTALPSAGTHQITYTNLKGADNSANPTTFEEGTGVASFTALADVTGYTFAGWSPASIADDATEDQTIAATWTPVQYAITYEGLEGATHSNPATYTIESEEIVFSAPSARAGYTFTGWTPASIAAGSHEAKTITANWEEAEPAGLIKLVNGTELNTEKFHTTITLSNASYVVDGKTYSKYLKFGGAFTTPKDSYQPNKFVRFDMTKKSATVKAYAYNKASSAAKFYVAVVEEDDAEGDIEIQSIDVPAKSGAVLSADFTVAKNASIYFLTGDNSNLFLCQASVLESGEALPVPCKPGYSINFVNPRFSLDESSGKTGSFDGFEMNSNAAIKVLNAANGIDTKTAGTHYIKFTLTERTKVNITATVPSGRAYSINDTKAYDAEVNSFTGNASVDLNAGTWYINPDAGTSTYIKKIAFAEPSALYTVTFNSNGGSSVDAQEVTDGGKVTEPADPTKATFDFAGWYANVELTTPFDFENTTISAATTIYAKWTAHVASTDATLASLTVNGNDILNGDEVEYTVYADVLPEVVATKNNEFATVTPTEAVAVPGTSTYLVTAESGATKTYTIHFVATANACGTLINATLTSNTAAAVTGVLGGTADVNVTSGSYKMDKGKYVGVTLAAGSFRAGDIVTINVTDKQNATGFCLYTEKDGTNLIIDTRDGNVIENGEYDIVLPNTYAGSNVIYVVRLNNSETGNLNACINSVKVTRDCNPQITDFEVASVHAAIDHSAETITAELPYGTSLASLNPTVTLGNGGTAYTPDGAQDFTSPVEYTVTGANGSRTYTVTLTVETHDPSMTLSSTSGTIALSGISPRSKSVKTTLSGEYLTAGTYTVATSAVEGVSIVPIQFTVAEDGTIADTEFTISYTSEVDVTSADVTFTFSDGSTSKVYTLTYSSEAKPILLPLLDVTGDMTWDFTNKAAADADATGTTSGDYIVLANTDIKGTFANAQYMAADYNKYRANAIQATGLKIHTTVPGFISVTFAQTGSDKVRELYINGVATGKIPSGTANETYTQFVEAGDVVLTSWEASTSKWQMFNYATITFKAAVTTIVRPSLEAGKIGTICLPYAVLAGNYEGATFYSITHKELKDGQLYKIFFEEVDNLVAGQPYIFEADGGNITAIHGDATAADSVPFHGLYGTFTGISKLESDGENIYIISNNKVRLVAETSAQTGEGVSLGANRAYINMADVPVDAPALAPGRKRISLGTNETNVATDLEAISGSDNIEKLMIDGVIYIRRGEKLYDVTGRLVK